MLTIAFCNQKGGVGKSTTAFHMARAALRDGLRVLVVDLDPQGNITTSLTKEPLTDDTEGVADVLSMRTPTTLSNVIVPTIWPGVDLVPTVGETLSLVRDELVVAGAGRENRLRDQLRNPEYDLILIDCPPSLDQLTINGLTAADLAVIVTHSKLWSANGLARLLESIRDVRRYYNPGLRVAGVVVNQHEAATTSGTHWLDELTAEVEDLGISIFDPPIPKRVIIADAVEASQALDQWPSRDGAGLAQIYTNYWHAIRSAITKEARND